MLLFSDLWSARRLCCSFDVPTAIGVAFKQGIIICCNGVKVVFTKLGDKFGSALRPLAMREFGFPDVTQLVSQIEHPKSAIVLYLNRCSESVIMNELRWLSVSHSEKQKTGSKQN